MNVSLICACKNRIKPLLISLQSWLLCDEIKEIIIVDWSSDEPIGNITHLDSRIKKIRVSDQKYFNQPQPLNLALKFCTQDYVLKVDTDYILNPYWNFFSSRFTDDNSFICGEYDTYIEHQVLPYFKYLRGLLLVKRNFLEQVGGWNENMGEYYGGEDGEVEKRLELYGLQKIKINLDYTIIHIPHSNKDRILNFKGYENDDLNQQIRNQVSGSNNSEIEWNMDYLLADHHIIYNINSFYNSISNFYVEPKTEWNMLKLDNQNYVAEMVNLK